MWAANIKRKCLQTSSHLSFCSHVSASVLSESEDPHMIKPSAWDNGSTWGPIITQLLRGGRNYQDIFPILQQMIYSICRNRQHLCFINNIQRIKKNDKKKCLTEKKHTHIILGKKETDKWKKTKKQHLIRRHLWLGNTCAVWVFPGGCSQASQAQITTEEPKREMHSDPITARSDVSSPASRCAGTTSLIYNDPPASSLNTVFIKSGFNCSSLWT